MPNGKPGDHPFTDIVLHGLAVYSPEADSLVREIAALGGRDRIADMLLLEFDHMANPDVPRLEHMLKEVRDQLRSAKESRGGVA